MRREHIIDLRSDTVTVPTPEMRDAMANAEVGDDVFGEDPTVNKLEELAARKVGKEAAMFVASGTMANVCAALTHCRRGEEAIVGSRAHMFIYEAGGMAALGGIQPHTVANLPDGTMDVDEIRRAFRVDDVHFPRTRMVCLENTHNRCSGMPLTRAYVASVADIAHERGAVVHVDGARVFNAGIALRTEVSDLVAEADSVSFCLSKGLAAPVGSLLCGARGFIAEARRTRKVLGGGMRQAGVIAAAGIVALERMVDRLAEDHANARELAIGISNLKGLRIDLSFVQTNIVYFELLASTIGPDELVARMAQLGIRFFRTAERTYRMVTHYGIGRDDIGRTLAGLQSVLTAA